ncbi:P-loop containing nucleoside triphosphate hydrolase protein [Byssothecium circinans]|uniref:P-loop containing nucleoside triphosphate hydrolase protein n=1 Tax=Byssothecium circinans TaxID=147558 RepID=A0A6A5TNP8_9PLEO|nr:P-loop containing nucleoside triphosphate hydrolase protein [Byssothecium circinans]
MSGTKTGSSPNAGQPPILTWYSKVYSRRIDLVGDYVGNELFLVDGNSLLLHCFSDEHLDFSEGFQLLHATWAVEHFLRDLVSRRCHFHIVFFHQYRDICVPSFAPEGSEEKYLLARAAIIRHLRANLKTTHPDIEINVFPSVTSNNFTEYLQATDFFFVLAHDGASPGVLRKRHMLAKHLDALEDEIHDEAHQKELETKKAFREFIHWFIAGGMSIALMNGIHFQDTKVITNVLENRHVDSGILATIDFTSEEIDEPRPNYLKRSFWDKMNGDSENQLTERQYVSLLVLSALRHGEDITEEFVDAFLRHMALISELHLSARLVDAGKLDEDACESLQEFCEEASVVLSSEEWAANMTTWQCTCDVADLVDGRLLAACLQNKSVGRNATYSSLVRAMASSGAGHVGDDKVFDQERGSQSPVSATPDASASYAVLPFSNSVFDPHLAPIQLAVDRSGEVAPATASQIFREVSHWHNSRRPMDPKIREDQVALNAKQMKKTLRRNQFFMAEMTTYAASLTNAVGKSLDPEIITPGGKPEKREIENTKQKPAQKANPKGAKKGAPSRKDAMLAQIAKDKSKKDEASSETVAQGWRLTCNNLEKEPTAIVRFQKAKQYLTTLNSEFKRNVLEAEVQLYLLNTQLSMWVAACKNADKEKNQHIAALVYDSLNTFSRLRRPITKTIAGCLDKTFKELGLPKLSIASPEGDRPLAFNFVLSDISGVSLALPTSLNNFQLVHCGPYLDRSMDSAPDPRVPFEPDAWQRKVLDEIDAKRSLLVVAPTSAGKTFISFYAMKQVLESPDDDILVYVAPTKALVNQIAAEVQGRFSKSYKYGGNSVWGIHTRDYRINNPTGCQILVTVPHILQIMLMAPSNANSWSKRVKWVIFDEVHCIGQADDGLIWEQLLLMAPCPIIALSATIGNPDEFSAWLTSTQKAVGNDLIMVQHPHRYSDLRKFVYTPGPKGDFQGLPESRAFARLGLDDCDAFTFLHPVTSLVNRSRGIPNDLSLEARDCLTLWQTMVKHQTNEYPVDKSLDPTAALPTIVKKLDIIKWENSLKAVLRNWMADHESPFEEVVKDLSSSLHRSNAKSNGDSAAVVKSDGENATDISDEDEPEDSYDAESILPLLVRLQEQDALPGIIFNYDRGLCERICETLMRQLETAETKWKETSPKWKSDLKKWEEYKAIMAKANKRNPPKLSKKKGNDEDGLTKEDIARDGANNEANPWASFDPERPVDRFHFADNRKLSREELDVYEKELVRRDVPEWLILALRRGIGVHHAGLNRKYRQVCEMLFRRGYLRVVVATGTLALGINMPCKTVVFSGDSVFLTALNYRQAAGRAGRRGFDMLGNVVFHGISMSKIHRLISSRLPDINGHFPITTTLVLRLFTLLNESKDSPFAIRAVNALLSQPRLYLGGEESKMTVLHHLRFSIEYLRRQFLLDSRGAPLNLAGCVSHLYFTENSSFAFHALLKDGYFHKLCTKIDTNRETVLQELILTMSHLFGRKYCRQADKEYVEHVVKRSPSIVFLPRMPESAAEVLRNHNQSTLEIYKAYVRTFVTQHLKEPDDTLPLTNVKISGNSSTSSPSGLKRRALTTVRSPFVALSGYGDGDIESIHDLCTTTRSKVFLEEAVVPYVGLYPDEADMPLNAYLYDFYNHGDVKALAVANRIRRGDVWFVLNDFSMVLATVVTSLSNFMNLSSDSELDVRGEGDDAEEAQEDKLLPDDSGYETGSTMSGASRGPAAHNALPVQVKKKKKVADSWDDDADEEEMADEAEAKAKATEAELKQLEEKPAWEEGTGLLNVLKAFKALKEEFDTKFRAMWA